MDMIPPQRFPSSHFRCYNATQGEHTASSYTVGPQAYHPTFFPSRSSGTNSFLFRVNVLYMLSFGSAFWTDSDGWGGGRHSAWTVAIFAASSLFVVVYAGARCFANRNRRPGTGAGANGVRRRGNGRVSDRRSVVMYSEQKGDRSVVWIWEGCSAIGAYGSSKQRLTLTVRARSTIGRVAARPEPPSRCVAAAGQGTSTPCCIDPAIPPAAAPKHGRKPPAEYDPSDGRTTIPPITAFHNYGLNSVGQQLANLNDTSGLGFRYLPGPPQALTDCLELPPGNASLIAAQRRLQIL